ncbi:efflux RND transporter periplasmic adaptor subunit [Dissulfurirhabdus thermomarina]|uniref:Efflux RND transporter periplasmic adaptor subunit n=1 Tax=Dissulfurirhabdus thermomarina TaxID=1765737 RepID=A0A6N9TKD3_DISTH|nr:efflux RND transporter periplasmic adaptor subunit [Dissulfurirhabdus thermomarina]NDY41559.1 efflux RND transporter periplasmic adaptor subunit [Dissulfurirhabdus thermomarina]NMX24524.1 efflux RND transporter periplasmic adaptor subunit [Dissulfurirhabdus thermomarina]
MKRTIIVVFLIVAALVIVGPSLLHKELVDAKDPATGNLPRRDIIRNAPPERRAFAETLRWFGKVKSRNRTRVIAMETGRIVSIAARDGVPVAKGDLLFTIGGPLVDSRLEVLQNQSATLRERITLAEQMVRVKREAVSRKFAKREELTVAEDALARLKAEMESVKQAIQQLQEATHIHAMHGGVFINRKVSVGQEVQKGDDLAEIISQDSIYIAATLFPKRRDAKLETKRAVINLPEGRQIQGTVTTVLPQRTAEGATVVWIEGPDLDSALSPGQTVAGTIILSEHEKALAVPQDAIVRDDEERAYVFIKGSSGYRRQPVKTGIIAGGWVEIVSGVKAEDEVVVQGAYELFYQDFNKTYKVAD